MAKAESSRESVEASEVGSDPDPNFEDENEDDCLGVDINENSSPKCANLLSNLFILLPGQNFLIKSLTKLVSKVSSNPFTVLGTLPSLSKIPTTNYKNALKPNTVPGSGKLPEINNRKIQYVPKNTVIHLAEFEDEWAKYPSFDECLSRIFSPFLKDDDPFNFLDRKYQVLNEFYFIPKKLFQLRMWNWFHRSISMRSSYEDPFVNEPENDEPDNPQESLNTFENELPPVREAPNSRLKEITELPDGSVQVQFASSSSSSRYSFTSSRPEPFQTFKQAEKQPSEKFKGVDFTPNIPKTHYSEEEDDSTRHGLESPTLSDMRSQRDQLNVISSTIDRKREFKNSKDSQIRSFRKNLKRLLSKEEMNRFWEEFYSYPEDISFFEWAYLKTFKQKSTINTFQYKSKIWKTTSGNTFQSVHPPLEEIVIPKRDVKVIASPLKQISDKGESDNPTIKDIKNIQQQNNYTNIILHSVATQLNQIEQPIQNELVKQDKVKGKEKAYEKTTNTSKTLFKPNENKVRFGFGPSDVLFEIVKQLRDKESTSKINVIDSIEELQEQFEELKINKLNDKSFTRHSLPHFYPRPTFPDMLHEEPTPPQKSFSGLEVVVWDIDGMTEHQIMHVIAEMSMASSAYSAKGNSDKDVAINILNGFSGQLKNCWFNYLSSVEREKITNAVKKEGDSHLDLSKQDAVCTLLFTSIKHFIGEPFFFMEKSSELLMNLTCPKLQDFKWYKDIFLQKVMFRDDCKSTLWKERFIAGLPKLFAERV
ncbi:Uncharacterized protein Adt_12139 [Abeliophyllum distichum]|uniref:DUF7746 domain-containing protein n=1 Tax=Abeliophyllum distichum TaxID=126358 RepID=A0ABD1UPX0_9LAMI